MKRSRLISGLIVVAIAAAIAFAYLAVTPAAMQEEAVQDAEQDAVQDAGQEQAQTSSQPTTAMVSVQMPAIEGNAAIGQRIFNTACIACHGENGVGVLGKGPPLIHIVYEPNHHGDEAFQRAVANGVTSHHWPFGNMPPVQGLTRGDVAMVVDYIRTIQRANGIQ